MFRLLFLSSGSSARHLIAEAFANKSLPEDIEVVSAIEEKRPTHPLAISIMSEIDEVIPETTEYQLTDLLDKPFDVVVTLCNRDKEECPPFHGSPALINWFIPDPLMQHYDEAALLEEFRCIRNEIDKKIQHFIEDGYLEAIKNQKILLGSLIENMTDGVLAHDANRRIFYFNMAAQRLTGFTYSDVIGRDCHDVFPGKFCGGNCSYCDLPSRKERSSYRRSFIRSDDQIREFEMSSITVNTPKFDLYAALIIFRDITEELAVSGHANDSAGFYGIVGSHPLMKSIFDTINEVAGHNVPVLISGESGTGKELIANAIHNLSNRQDQPFVPVNCGALPENLLESELFGHVKGSFTGAIRDKKGRFELADGGTIFLDEIADIPLSTQVKLLRVLQDMSFTPVGGEKQIKVNTRVISATNKDLKQLVDDGLFREDLYYRLAVVPIHTPSLRERASDIPQLVDFFLKKFRKETGRDVTGMNHSAMNYFKHYSWPGNIRELANAVQYSIIKTQGTLIDLDDLPAEITDGAASVSVKKPGRHPKLSIDDVERVLRDTGGNKSKAARILGVSRPTLYSYIEQMIA